MTIAGMNDCRSRAEVQPPPAAVPPMGVVPVTGIGTAGVSARLGTTEIGAVPAIRFRPDSDAMVI